MKTKHKFQFKISQIICQGLSSLSNVFGLILIFPDMQLTANEMGTNPKFKIKKTFEIEDTFEHLSNIFIQFDFFTLKEIKNMPQNFNINKLLSTYSSKLTRYASIKFDLLTIVIGPKFYDVMLYENNTSNLGKGRLSFHIEANQINKVTSISNNLIIELDQTQLSENYPEIAIVNTDRVLEKKVKTPNSVIKGDFITKEQNDNGNNISYYKINRKVNEIEQELSLEELKFCSFYLSIFGLNQKTKKFEIIGYYKALFNRFLSVVFKEADNQMTSLFNLLLINSNKSSEIKEINFNTESQNEGLVSSEIKWNDNIKGKVSLFLKVFHVPLILQFPCGIFTEYGIAINSYNLYSYLHCSEKSFASFKNVASHLKSLYQTIKEKININKYKEHPDFDISRDLTQIYHLLDESISDKFFCYQYDKFEDIYEAQDLMLKIGLLIYKILLKLNSENVIIGLDIIKIINQREEFEQTIICDAWIQYDKGTNSYTFKEEVVKRNLLVMFFEFNMNCRSISKFSDKPEGNQTLPQSRIYLSYLCANNFFKNVMFRKAFIKSMTAGSEQEKLQYVSPLYPSIVDSYPDSKVLFWDLNFGEKAESAIKSLTQHNDKIKKLSSLMSEIQQKEVPFPQLKNQTAFAFEVIKNVFQLTLEKLGRSNIRWLLIANFDSLLNALFYQVDSNDLSNYPSNLNELICLFVNEPKILNKFINIIIKKTNAFNTSSVYYVIDLIDNLFTHHKKVFHFKMDFDYSLLFTAFKIIVNVQNCLTISKMLWLYYKNAHLMPVVHLIEISKIILKPFFYHFSFHWSWKIRKIWYNLLIYILLNRLDSKIHLCELEFDKGKQNQEEKYSDFYSENMELLYKIKTFYLNSGQFELNEPHMELIKDSIPKENWVLIDQSITEFIQTENEFERWKANRAKSPDVDYPILVISNWKDDIEY